MSIQQVARGMLIPHQQIQEDEEENIAFLDPITYELFNAKLVIDQQDNAYNSSDHHNFPQSHPSLNLKIIIREFI